MAALLRNPTVDQPSQTTYRTPATTTTICFRPTDDLLSSRAAHGMLTPTLTPTLTLALTLALNPSPSLTLTLALA
eukprot:scaffold14296_cov60-Phaeocystis_antarctica.AAC.4